MARRFQFGLLLVALMLAFLAAVSANAQVGKRLILKDGSYQPTNQWEVKGDRVRYYSTERAEWEEVPNSLIDWKATQAWNSQAHEPSQDLRQTTDEEREEIAREEAKTPTIAPGIKLPESGGVFALDVYRGKPQAAELVQTGTNINKDTGKNILRAAINPIASAKQSIELKGTKARVQLHVQQPELFVDIDTDTQQQPLALADHFRIARLERKKDVRVLGNIKIAVYGKVSQQQTFVPARAEKFSGDWIRIVPAEPLAPGEYAVVEMLAPKEMNLYVWDFGVDPAAPENSGQWKPEPAKENAGYDSPVLKPGASPKKK